MRRWINKANDFWNVANEDDLQAKKAAAQEIFGSNLVLKTKKISQASPKDQSLRLKTHWMALRAARQTVLNDAKNEKSPNM